MDKSLVSEIRKSKGWTQEYLAEKSFVTVRTIQRLEAGETVSIETLQAVSMALAVTVSDLFEYVDTETREVEFMEVSKEQTTQLNQRHAEYSSILSITIGIAFLFMGLFGWYVLNLEGMNALILGTVWISLIFIIIGFITYITRVILSRKLDSKYPLTKGVQSNNKRSDQIDNIWQFLAHYWWIIFPIGGFLSWLVPALFYNH